MSYGRGYAAAHSGKPTAFRREVFPIPRLCRRDSEAQPPEIIRRTHGKPRLTAMCCGEAARFKMRATSIIEVTRTYLEMRDPSELQTARRDDPRISIEQIPGCAPAFFRYLYIEVGRNYNWIDRLPWTDADIAAHLAQPEISIWLMTYEGETAGYFELRRCEDDSVEIAYFGLLPPFIGRGLGKHLLTCATEEAWAMGTRRVWLHTCTLDDKAAMPNYLKRGFRAFKTEEYAVDVSEGASADQTKQ